MLPTVPQDIPKIFVFDELVLVVAGSSVEVRLFSPVPVSCGRFSQPAGASAMKLEKFLLPMDCLMAAS